MNGRQRAFDAIDESIYTDDEIDLAYDTDSIAVLQEECDEGIDTDMGTEYYGSRCCEGGGPWRVRVANAPDERVEQ